MVLGGRGKDVSISRKLTDETYCFTAGLKDTEETKNIF